MKTKKTKATEAAAVSVAFRLSAELLARLDAHAARLAESMPGMTVTRTDALRTLLISTLDEAERKAKATN